MGRFADFYNTAAWRKLSKWRRTEEPLCRMCLQMGIFRAGTQVDHIIPLAVDWDKRLDSDNTQNLCLTCHSSVKAKQERTGRLAGNAADGQPLDKGAAWWNR